MSLLESRGLNICGNSLFTIVSCRPHNICHFYSIEVPGNLLINRQQTQLKNARKGSPKVMFIVRPERDILMCCKCSYKKLVQDQTDDERDPHILKVSSTYCYSKLFPLSFKETQFQGLGKMLPKESNWLQWEKAG